MARLVWIVREAGREMSCQEASSRLFSMCPAAPLCREVVAADAENGRRIAERWCVDCHAVSRTQKSTSTEAPPFSGVARKSGFDASMLALFRRHPHPKVPDIGLSRDAAPDLAACIARQRE